MYATCFGSFFFCAIFVLTHLRMALVQAETYNVRVRIIS
jgi:hypothetical protein